MANGIGPFWFGQPKGEVAYGLEPILGYANRDSSTAYPNMDANGDYLDDAGTESFIAPYGSEVCFDNGLCVYFGGTDAESQTFVGYHQGDTNTANDPTLSTKSGVTVGSAWADYTGVMEVSPGGCYTYGGGRVDDVLLDLESSGTNFGGFDESGNWVSNVPGVDEVTVMGIHTGAMPISLEGDC